MLVAMDDYIWCMDPTDDLETLIPLWKQEEERLRSIIKNAAIPFISYQENMDTTSPLGQALFTIVAAVAQLERDLIRERVNAGIRNARVAGKQLGRPMWIVDREQILRLRADGTRIEEIAATVGVGYGTVRKRLAQAS